MVSNPELQDFVPFLIQNGNEAATFTVRGVVSAINTDWHKLVPENFEGKESSDIVGKFYNSHISLKLNHEEMTSADLFKLNNFLLDINRMVTGHELLKDPQTPFIRLPSNFGDLQFKNQIVRSTSKGLKLLNYYNLPREQFEPKTAADKKFYSLLKAKYLYLLTNQLLISF